MRNDHINEIYYFMTTFIQSIFSWYSFSFKICMKYEKKKKNTGFNKVNCLTFIYERFDVAASYFREHNFNLIKTMKISLNFYS